MSMLRDLLATWESWSARDTLARAIATATTDDTRKRISASLAEMPATAALDALRDSTELVELITGWQWQAVYAARLEGASWEEIAVVTHTAADAARAAYLTVVDRHERVLERDVREYRKAL